MELLAWEDAKVWGAGAEASAATAALDRGRQSASSATSGWGDPDAKMARPPETARATGAADFKAMKG